MCYGLLLTGHVRDFSTLNYRHLKSLIKQDIATQIFTHELTSSSFFNSLSFSRLSNSWSLRSWSLTLNSSVFSVLRAVFSCMCSWTRSTSSDWGSWYSLLGSIWGGVRRLPVYEIIVGSEREVWCVRILGGRFAKLWLSLLVTNI